MTAQSWLPSLLNLRLAQKLKPAQCERCAAFVDSDCAVIKPMDPNPVSSRATGLSQINRRIMPYCINLLCGNVVCMGGGSSGFSGYYSAINPQYQVDLLNTTTMPLRFVTGEQPRTDAAQPTATECSSCCIVAQFRV